MKEHAKLGSGAAGLPLRHGGRRSLWRRIYESRSSYLLMAPFMILFFVLTIVPILSSIVLSFTNFNMQIGRAHV
jgi:multiple sugar transport system permease protein